MNKVWPPVEPSGGLHFGQITFRDIEIAVVILSSAFLYYSV